ncbi:MAG: hypothetical protein R3F65_30465 [bacterium]
MSAPFCLSMVRRATAPTAAWIGRIVHESAPGVVSLSDDPTTQVPLGIVREIDVDLEKVSVVVAGEVRVRVGAAGLTAGSSSFIAAAEGATAAEDGKAGDATAGDFYVGRVIDLLGDAGEDAVVLAYVAPGQLARAEGT